MTQQLIVTTPANTGTGDSPKAAFDKINANFTSLFNQIGGSLAGTITNYGAVSGTDAGAAITAAAAANDLVIIPQGTWPIAAIPVIPANVTIETLPGATFSGAGAVALGFTALNIDAFSLTSNALGTTPPASGFYGPSLSLSSAIQVGIGAGSLDAGLSVWQPLGHANWNIVQTTVPYNPTEWQVYTNAANGIAQVVGGTNQVVLVQGTPFVSSWVGQPYFFFEGTAYKVATVTDGSHLTVTTVGGGGVTFGSTVNGTFFFVATTITATVNVNGTSVTWVSGQPFTYFTGPVLINGTTYTISTINSTTSLTLTTSAGTLTGATFVQWIGINNEIATFRLQSLFGSNEEGFTITVNPTGTQIYNGYAGSGKYRPIFLQTGESPIGTLQTFLSLRPSGTLGNNGTLGIGGDTSAGNQAISVSLNSSAVNYFSVSGAPTGFGPSIAVRGTDTAPGFGLDVQGAGVFSFTSHSYGNFEFQVNGNGAASYLSVGSAATAPAITANGTPTNVDIALTPKGSGAVWLGTYTAGVQTSTGYMTVKDSSGTTRKLLCL